MLNRSWVEIDLRQLKLNLNECRKYLKKGQDIIVVVKADAYGHGDVQVAKALEEIGVKHFAVSNAEEGVRLRKNGITGSILVLSYTPMRRLEDLCRYDIMQTVISEDYAQEIALSKIPVRVQIAVDTGMNRLGFNTVNTISCIKSIYKYSKVLHLCGIFTHLSTADEKKNEAFTVRQISKFKEIVDGCKLLNFKFIHCMNSAGTLRYNSFDFNFVRLGVVLYGLSPSSEFKLNCNIKPILKWKSVVSMLKTVERGEYIGYGLSFMVKRRSIVATIPTGYADGYNRRLSNKGFVIINNQKAPIVGKICMDQFMVDVTDIAFVKQGDEVELVGDLYTVDDMANDLDTISYEVVCAISKRVYKIYLK